MNPLKFQSTNNSKVTHFYCFVNFIGKICETILAIKYNKCKIIHSLSVKFVNLFPLNICCYWVTFMQKRKYLRVQHTKKKKWITLWQTKPRKDTSKYGENVVVAYYVDHIIYSWFKRKREKHHWQRTKKETLICV